MVFIKQRDSSGFHIISDFYVDYFDMAMLMEKIGRENFLQIMSKVQSAYSQIMDIHPDAQFSNFLVKVTRDGDSFEMDYMPIDFEKNPRSSSPLEGQNAGAKVASAPTDITNGNEFSGEEVKGSTPDSSSSSSAVGGIDFNADKMILETRSSGGEIKFQINPQKLREFQNAPGFVPVIINIQPLINLPLFLGLKDSQPMTVAAAKE